jgi:hypothetical protein
MKTYYKTLSAQPKLRSPINFGILVPALGMVGVLVSMGTANAIILEGEYLCTGTSLANPSTTVRESFYFFRNGKMSYTLPGMGGDIISRGTFFYSSDYLEINFSESEFPVFNSNNRITKPYNAKFRYLITKSDEMSISLTQTFNSNNPRSLDFLWRLDCERQ